MYIDVTYNFSTIASQVIAVWANNNQPNVEVGRKVIDGVNVEKQGTFRADNLLNAVYQFRYYESANGLSLDALLMPPDYVKAGQTDFAVAIYHYIPDRGYSGGVPGEGNYWEDPAADTDTIIDERLKGATVNEVEVQVRGIESLSPEEFEMIPAGGIRLLNGQTFMQGNPANIKHFKKVERIGGGQGSSAGEAFYPIIGSGALSGASFFKNNFGAFLGLAEILFPAFSTMPDGTWLKFSTYNLQNTSQLVLQFAQGDSIFFAGALRNRIVLGASEEISLYFYVDNGIIKGLAFNGASCARGYQMAGQVTNGTYQLLNTLIAGPTAPLYNQSEFPRLMDVLPPVMIVPLGDAIGQWNYAVKKVLYGLDHWYQPYRTKFGFDNVAGTFRLPVIDEIYLKYGRPDSQVSRFTSGVGSMGWNDNLIHHHMVLTNGSSTSGSDPIRALRRNNVQADPYNHSEIIGNPIIERAGDGKVNVDNFLNLPLIGI